MKAIQSPAPFPLEEVQSLLVQTVWAKERPIDMTAKMLEGSLNFGIVNEEGRLVAYARLVTDHILLAYLADVVVDKAYRGQGLGKMLMEKIMAHPIVPGLKRFVLVTGNAHGLYSRYGFKIVENPTEWMHIFNDALRA